MTATLDQPVTRADRPDNAMEGGRPADASLTSKVRQGAVVSLGFFAATNGIRLASNLLLAYLLFPGAFGLMAMVGVVMQALKMFSDVGIRPSLVQSTRGEEPDFYNTAWTIQVGRGLLLTLGAWALAMPAAWWFNEPKVFYLILAIAFTATLDGFRSTSFILAGRKLQLTRQFVLTLVAQVSAVATMIVWAMISPTVWAMVANGLVFSLLITVFSHTLMPEGRNGFRWDRSAVHELFGFGRWVFLSTLFTFVSMQADKILLGRMLDAQRLGVYQIAFGLSVMLQSVVEKMTRQVIYPALCEVVRDRPERLREVYYRARVRTDGLALPLAGLLAVFGSALIEVMYDDRYLQAGWIFQVLMIRTAMVAMLAPAENVLFALGHPKYAFYRSLFRAVFLVGAMLLGWHYFGLQGVVWAVAVSEVPVLLVLWWGGWRHGVLDLLKEARAVAMFAAGAGVGWGLRELLGWA